MAKKATKKKAAKKVTKKVTKKAAKKATKKVAKKATKKAAKKAAPKSTKTVAKKAPKKAMKKAAPAKAVSGKTWPLPAVGTTAPGFTLKDQDGQEVSLESFRGSNVLVYFYPRAMTPGCTVQACGLRDSSSDLGKQGIVVLGVSPDQPKALKKFIEKDHLNFTLLSDPDHAVAQAYGAFGPKQFMGKHFDGILRQSYLIGKDGKLLHIIQKVDTATHAQDVLKLFQDLA